MHYWCSTGTHRYYFLWPRLANTTFQHYFPALLAMAILLTRSVDDLGARVRAPVLALALETVLVPDPVAVLLVELLAADVLGELRSPVGVRLLVRQAW